MGDQLEKIGTNSILDAGDAKYLLKIAEKLRDRGEHSNAIYVDKMVQNAAVREAIPTDNRKLFDFDTMLQVIENDKTKKDSSWEMYLHDIVSHVLHKMNAEIIAALKLNRDQKKFKFTLDYRKLADMSDHTPPFYREDGLRLIATRLLNIAGNRFDWEMKIKKCTESILVFTVSRPTVRLKLFKR